MKNKILLSLITVSLLNTASFADNKSDIKELKEQLSDLQAYIEEVEENLESAETKILTDKIKFGLGMRVEMNNYKNTYANGDSFTASEVYRTKLNLNMKAKIANNLKFSGRLSMYKNWGDSTQRNTNYDSMQGRRPDSSAVYVERAYLDWLTNPNSKIPFIVTLGRQASSDGPSYQIKEGTTRKGTYDALAFDGAADGIVFTANLNSISKGTSIRFAYGTPNVLDNEAYSNEQMNYSGKDKSSFENTKVSGLFIDQVFPSLKFENLTQVFYVKAKDMNANPAYLYPYAGTPASQNAAFMQSNDVNVGDLELTGAMFEASKVNGKFDFFIHYTQSVSKPNGKSIVMGSDTTGDGVKDQFQSIGLLDTTMGSNADGSGKATSTSSKTGNAIWIGGRYSINKTWKIGAEYNKGSKNWFSFTSGSNDPLNKLATRGTATEIYGSYAVNKYANIRIGIVNINYDYTGSGSHLGKADKISDLTPATGSTQIIEKTKNTYITFNVLF